MFSDGGSPEKFINDLEAAINDSGSSSEDSEATKANHKLLRDVGMNFFAAIYAIEQKIVNDTKSNIPSRQQ